MVNKTEEEYIEEMHEMSAQARSLKHMTSQQVLEFSENYVNDYWDKKDILIVNIFLEKALRRELGLPELSHFY